MTKEEAREYLNRWITNEVYHRNKVELPINDYIILHKDEIRISGYREITEYSFVGLLKIAYDLN